MVEGATNFVAPPVPQMYEGDPAGRAARSAARLRGPREIRGNQSRACQANYPLNIVSPKSHGFLNSCYANMEHKIKGQGEQFVMMSPKDAEARSIREGDPVRVFNDRGDFEGLPASPTTCRTA